VPADIEAALIAWGLWSRVDDHGLGFKPRAGSAEGLHLAELGNVLEADRRPAQGVIADELACRIEAAVIGSGPTLAAVLVQKYVWQQPLLLRDRGLLDEAHHRVGHALVHAAIGTAAVLTQPAAPRRRAGDARARERARVGME